MAWITRELELRGREFTFHVEGEVTGGGSNGYGSDEPAWSDVEDLTFYREDWTPVKPLTQKALKKQHGAHMEDLLIESES